MPQSHTQPTTTAQTTNISAHKDAQHEIASHRRATKLASRRNKEPLVEANALRAQSILEARRLADRNTATANAHLSNMHPAATHPLFVEAEKQLTARPAYQHSRALYHTEESMLRRTNSSTPAASSPHKIHTAPRQTKDLMEKQVQLEQKAFSWFKRERNRQIDPTPSMLKNHRARENAEVRRYNQHERGLLGKEEHDKGVLTMKDRRKIDG